MTNVVFGFLGTQLDAGYNEKRWDRWRPSISLCAHEDFPVDRLELFVCKEEHLTLARQIAADMERVSPRTEVVAHRLDLPDPWDFPAVYAALHDFATKYRFSEHEQYYVHLTTGTHIAQICLFLLTEARYFPAKLVDTAMVKEIPEPWRGRVEVIDLNLASYDLLASRFAKEQADSASLLKSGISTRNAAFNKMIADIEKVCLRSSAPILLMGPTGAGKSQLARRIFDLRARRNQVAKAFVEVNCATLRGENAMSTLFGHKKGAFTGAVADRAGLLKSAHKGTLFLDEIGELGLDEQAMLLRALEEKKFYPVGSDQEVDSDFQLIAGTNRDLSGEVAAGRFRADLYARVNLWAFTLPGLADRPEDIEPNLEFELQQASAALNSSVTMSADARRDFLRFALSAPWTGNFRDLSAAVMRMATLAEGGRILPEIVADEIARLSLAWRPTVTAKPPQDSLVALVLAEPLDPVDTAQLEVVLRAIRDTRSMAEASREIFSVSRHLRKTVNDSDRLRKFLGRWQLAYAEVKAKVSPRIGEADRG